MKKILPYVQLQSNPAVASPREQLYEQMTSNPVFTERNIQKANACLLYSHPEQNLPSLYVCVWLVNTLTSTASIGSPISACHLQLIFANNGTGIYLSVQQILLGKERVIRTSSWEANVKLVDNVNILKSKLRSIQLYFFILLYFSVIFIIFVFVCT